MDTDANLKVTNDSRPTWVHKTLLGCFVYYFLSGIWLLFQPTALFELSQIPPPNYPWLVQLAGLMTAIFGFVFLVCAKAPKKYVAFIAIGLAAQILLPIFTLTCWILGKIPTAPALSLAVVDTAWAVALGLCVFDILSPRNEHAHD